MPRLLSNTPRKPLLATTSAIDHPRSHMLDRKHQETLHPPSHKSIRTSSSRAESVLLYAGDSEMDLSNMSRKSQWIILAIASGACAAFNGVFAKLTTTELTTTFATSIAQNLGLGSGEKAVEVVIRAMFFGLNLIFNGVMWALFTKALARGTSTTQVSIINTSANFMITAILGFMIFSESLPPLWWAGAALLVAGNVIIGRREEKDSPDPGNGGHVTSQNGEAPYGLEGDGLLDESVELLDDSEVDALKRTTKVDDDDILDLGDHVDATQK